MTKQDQDQDRKDHGGMSFMEAFEGAVKIQRELEKQFGKPPAGHPTSRDLDTALETLKKMERKPS